MKGRLALIASVTLALLAPSAFSQPAKKPAPPSPAPPSSSSSPSPSPSPSLAPPPLHAGAILHIAHEIAQGLGQVPAGVIVVASPITTDVPAPKSDELATRLAAHVAGRLGNAKAHPQPAALPVARGLSGRAASLVYLQIEIAKGELRVTADLYPVVSNGWERLRNPVPGPRAHAFAMAPLDAEVRGFLVPVLLESLSVHKIKHEEGEVLAVGCGDVDGDGGNELVIVTRVRVSIAKIKAGKLVILRAVPWAAIASRAPVPMREPLASVLVSPRGHRGEILLGTTDRGGIAIDGALVARRQLTGLPIMGGDGEACARPSAEVSAYEGDAIGCEPPVLPKPPPNAKPAPKVEPPAVFVPPVNRYDAIATFDNVARDGTVAQVVASREPNGKLRLRRQEVGAVKPFEVTLDGVGAQIALVDLDLDGTPEIVSTTENAEDIMVISSLTRTGVTARLRFPAREGVRALGVCPPEDKGVPGLVAVVGSEVWLVR